MNYKDFEKALESLEIMTRISHSDLKNQYQKLSKLYHPDMPNGDDEKFKKINESYKIINEYMKNYRFSLDEEEFYKQNPFSNKNEDWFKSYNC